MLQGKTFFLGFLVFGMNFPCSDSWFVSKAGSTTSPRGRASKILVEGYNSFSKVSYHEVTIRPLIFRGRVAERLQRTKNTFLPVPLKESNRKRDSASTVVSSQTQEVSEAEARSGDDYEKINTTFLPGKRKWLGGAITKNKSIIYGIPSNSKSVLQLWIPNNEEVHEYDDNNPPKNHVLSPSSRQNATVSMISLPLKRYWHGKFKWLRGILAQNDRYLYGIPAWSNQGVLQVDLEDPAKPKVQVLPLPFSPLQRQETDAASPHDKIDKATDGADYQTEVDITRWMWHGAALSKDETCIICIPSNARRVLRIDLPTSSSNATVTEIGPILDNKRNKWYGGIVGDDGAVYGIPYTTKDILRVDPSTNDVQLIPVTKTDSSIGEDEKSSIHAKSSLDYYQYNWHGGIKSPINGAIYAFPSHADTVLKIDTRPSQQCSDTNKLGHIQVTQLAINRSNVDDCTVTKYKWLGGSIGADNCTYGMPSDATSVLKIDPTTDYCTTISARHPNDPTSTSLISREKNKYQGGVLSPTDGCIYAIPCNAQNILCIDTNNALLQDKRREDDESWRIKLVGNLSATKDKWQGAFLGRDGNIYGIPENADQILKITPKDDSKPRITFV